MAPADALRNPAAEMPLSEHLEELRSRLIRSIVYLLLGLAIGWAAYPGIHERLWEPVRSLWTAHPDWGPVLTDVTQAFTLRLQVSFYAGLLVALPLITLEAWAFLAPGLTRSERRACAVAFPFSVALFFLGAGYGYLLMEPTLQWFAGYVPSTWKVLLTPPPYLTFMAKLVVGFGVAFQTPAVVLLLARLGLVSFEGLRRNWRACLVGCVVLAALATPGGDALVMLALAGPLVGLYGVCLAGCWLLERLRDRRAH